MNHSNEANCILKRTSSLSHTRCLIFQTRKLNSGKPWPRQKQQHPYHSLPHLRPLQPSHTLHCRAATTWPPNSCLPGWAVWYFQVFFRVQACTFFFAVRDCRSTLFFFFFKPFHRQAPLWRTRSISSRSGYSSKARVCATQPTRTLRAWRWPCSRMRALCPFITVLRRQCCEKVRLTFSYSLLYGLDHIFIFIFFFPSPWYVATYSTIRFGAYDWFKNLVFRASSGMLDEKALIIKITAGLASGMAGAGESRRCVFEDFMDLIKWKKKPTTLFLTVLARSFYNKRFQSAIANPTDLVKGMIPSALQLLHLSPPP